MDAAEKRRIENLVSVLEDNYAITRLYADYLSLYPTAIKPEYVKELAEDGTDEVSCIVALLAEIFGLDMDRSARERTLIREYLYRSVRILDPKKYTENEYYKNIKIPDVADGRWELKWQTYPAYRGFIAGDMIIRDNLREIPPLGFFAEDFSFPAVLEDGNEWMTLTPVDLDTAEEAIDRARGKVLTLGLGLGYFTYMASEKAEVDSVTVVELSDDVISLFKTYILPQFPNKDKVRIIKADAIAYAKERMAEERYDVVFADIWRDASDGEPAYRQIKACEHLCPGTEFIYWIEGFIKSRIRSMTLESLIDSGTEELPYGVKTYEELVHKLTDMN